MTDAIASPSSANSLRLKICVQDAQSSPSGFTQPFWSSSWVNGSPAILRGGSSRREREGVSASKMQSTFP